MTLDEVHEELTLLGVSSEVHNLVDDLELYPREFPLGVRLLFKEHKPVDIPKNVYIPKIRLQETQGRFGEDYNRPLWYLRGMSRKKAIGICCSKRLRSRNRK